MSSDAPGDDPAPPDPIGSTPLLRTVTVPVEELVEWPGNPRKHADAALNASVRRHGQYRSLLARELPDGSLQLLAGHGTKAALARAGRITVDVEVRDVPDDSEARAIVLADNRLSDLAIYDDELLLAQLEQASQAGLDGTGWDAATYQDLISRSRPPDLDSLAAEVGEPTEEDGYVVVRVSCPRETRDQFNRLMALGDGSDADRFSQVLAWAATAARSDGLDTMP